MVRVCEENGILFAGGALSRAYPQVTTTGYDGVINKSRNRILIWLLMIGSGGRNQTQIGYLWHDHRRKHPCLVSRGDDCIEP